MLRITETNNHTLCWFFAIALLASVTPAKASSFKVLYSFTGGADDGNPGSVILDGDGNLYGATGLINGYTAGAVYELTPGGTPTILSYFSEGSGGYGPNGVTLDSKGNLWGPLGGGGNEGNCGGIFEITARGREKLVYTFGGAPHDGCAPDAALTMDGSGDFFGTTTNGGKDDDGVVFELKPGQNDTLPHSFRGGRDGFYPFAGLILDTQGNLYGATVHGGRVRRCSADPGCGTIFKLTPEGTKTELYEFKGPPEDGYNPEGTLLMDSFGNLYGTTLGGGRQSPRCYDDGCGIAFKLAPDGKETVLHFFEAGKSDGGNPVAGLIADSAGNLYGTTYYGGSNSGTGYGTVFKVAPDGTETILHKFKESTDGAYPIAELVADSLGNLYGTAVTGGAYGYGTVFEITP